MESKKYSMSVDGKTMRILLVCLFIISSACADNVPYRFFKPTPELLTNNLREAESQADHKARRILRTGREMTLDEKAVIVGGCWDYVDAVFTRAGFPRGERKIVFKGTLKNGPYANKNALKPGDWIYHINHSYNGIEHSGIFIKWLDKGSATGLLLSYRGEKSRVPARYRGYDLSNVYSIIRAK
jgi:hypothetical protein